MTWPGQRELKCRAVIAVVDGPQTAAVSFDDRMADGQSHPHAFGLGREERIENPSLVFRRDADTGVADGDEHFIGVLHPGRDHEKPRPAGDAAHCFNAIQDQIHDYLLQLDPVGHDGREIEAKVGLEINLVSQCRSFYQSNHLANQLVDLQLSFFQARPW